MARRDRRSILYDLVEMPWWVSVVIAGLVYCFCRGGFPAFAGSNPILKPLSAAIQQNAWIGGLIFLIPAPFAAFRQYQRGKLLDSQSDLDSIRALSWQQFEKLVAEAFHRKGYSVVEEGGSAPDGGIDLVLRKQNEKVLVQCKHWRSSTVSVSVVREMFGVMHAERATGCVIVTSGSFTGAAIEFASGKPIQLRDGPQLEKLVQSVKGREPIAPTITAPKTAKPVCPDCGAAMKIKTARKGKFAGSNFWSCSRFPACKGIRQVA
jgi:restriction system protein